MAQKVLIIDDSPAIHALIRARLREEPLDLHATCSGRDGITLARTLEPDLILLDVDMPDPNGFEVCRLLKLEPELQGTPIIFLTGTASSQAKIRGLDLGAVDYVSKPFDPAELRARVRAALQMKFMIDLLNKRAQIDSVTGLWNRRFFDGRFEAELSLSRRSGRPLSVVLLDIDGFRKINVQLGRPAGDEVLRAIAELLVNSIRAEDVVCRFGGDEFAILAPNVAEGAATLARRLVTAVEEMSLKIGGKALPITVSAGVGIASEIADGSIVAAAQGALDRARQSGPGCVGCAPLIDTAPAT